MVEIHGLNQVHGALFNIEIPAELGGLGAGQVGKEVHRPALETHENAVRIFNDLEGDLVQIRRLSPILLKALQDDIVLCGPGDIPKRPGAHRGGVLPVVVRREDG